MLCSLKFSRFWKAVNGNFLLAILSGIGLSVFSLAKLITYLLVQEPVLVWSFFFGLVLASIWFVSREVAQWNAKTVIAFAAGAVAAYAITITTPAETSNDLWFIFLCGAIAICAMILPGISGSFILVLLGKYFFIMDAVKSLRISVLLVFAGGSVIGISLFSRALSYALHRFHDITIAILSGFMLGSLNKVWPWKETIETYIDRHGVAKPLIETNILPDRQLWEAIGLAFAGFAIVYLLERLSLKNKKEKTETPKT